ncbi:beta-lactamase class A/beta-lactamase class A VEB [Sphingobacterium lactis]|uniref:beta-lactamase n=2 Tax=Sphingobacterium lactis TaxID=797291 RepID=A0A1H5Z0K3_9SPHI|nr:beta-lactamase class A/beta-lactamase class A VEB [Sphingobacterium lactis]
MHVLFLKPYIMQRFHIVLLLVMSLICRPFQSHAQSPNPLTAKIEQIIKAYDAKVGVAVHNQEFTEHHFVNKDHKYPMQSVFKFHLGIAVLNQVDSGKLRLDQDVVITKADVSNELYSPIREKFPNGTTMPLSQVLHHTIAQSDNVGCNVLFRMLGGPDQVQAYFEKQGYTGIAIRNDESEIQGDWEVQFKNWIDIETSNKILYDYYTNDKQQLSESSYQFLWDTMRGTSTGRDRIKGLLPAGTVVAHKTGYSGQNKKTKEIAAVNDIGVVTLPNDKVFYITVLVTDAKEPEPNCAKIIAEVAKAAYDHYANQPL